MRVSVFSSQPYDQSSLLEATPDQITWQFYSQKLDLQSVFLAKDADAVCVFVNDTLNDAVLTALAELQVRFVVLRCAGFNQVDLLAAKRLGLKVARVPAYSPEAVAEHCVAMMLCLNRKLHKAYNRVREDNFNLQGLLGFNLHGKTVGLIGTGRIGQATARILAGFGMRILCTDPNPQPDLLPASAEFVSFNQLVCEADIISLHCPLTPQSQHLINATSLAQMKPGVMLINTSRGGLVDTSAVIQSLKSRHIGYLGLDVYEQEADLFFKDRSGEIIDDELFQRLLTFPNVLITGHQAFFTTEALTQIAHITCANLLAFAANMASGNEL